MGYRLWVMGYPKLKHMLTRSFRYVPLSLNFGAIRHGLSIDLSVVRIRFKNNLHKLIGGNDAGN
ncbi:MAG: hypothetical protein DDT31_01802 [Syntrophomonadaceae bacterium]|nr:hypothetical protein [Bacillota bacterium]